MVVLYFHISLADKPGLWAFIQNYYLSGSYVSVAKWRKWSEMYLDRTNLA
jgi:hypothetical protein